MPIRLLAGILAAFVALTGPSLAVEPDPAWWETDQRKSRTLPELVHAGWQIVGFDVHHGESTVTRDYILQHPSKAGVWHCNALYTTHDDGTNDRILSCGELKKPD